MMIRSLSAGGWSTPIAAWTANSSRATTSGLRQCMMLQTHSDLHGSSLALLAQGGSIATACSPVSGRQPFRCIRRWHQRQSTNRSSAPAEQPVAELWYYQQQSEQRGPVSLDDLKALLASGQV